MQKRPDLIAERAFFVNGKRRSRSHLPIVVSPNLRRTIPGVDMS
jgi:hypothetical protein